MASSQGNPDSRPVSISGEQGKRTRAAEHFDLGSVLISSLGDAKQSKQWGQQSNLRECLSVWHSWDGMSPCWGASTHAGEAFDRCCHAFEHDTLNAADHNQGSQPYVGCVDYFDNPFPQDQDMPNFDIATGGTLVSR